MTTTILNDIDATVTNAQVPSHLIVLDGEKWAFWRSAVLRGAGFPAQWVERMAAPEAAAAADDLLRMENEFHERLEELSNAVRRASDATTDKSTRNQLRKVLDKLRKGRLPEKLDDAVDPEWQSARAAASRLEDTRAAFEMRFHADVVKISDEIAAVANDDRFRQAVLLQNRQALNCVVRSFAGPDGSRNRSSRQRQHEELIANYLQRYCVKNDSIGFFGPVGWIHFEAGREGIDMRPGPDLIRRSEVYLEHWAIEALAEKIAEDKAVRTWIAPRRRPEFRLEGGRLHHYRGSDAIPPLVAAILAECDGKKLAAEIAAKFRVMLGGKELEIVLQILEQLASRDVIVWKFELSYASYPDRRLRSLLERIGPEEIRKPAMQMLDDMESARERVAGALGSAEPLDRTLGELNEDFFRLTGKDGSRAAGQMYAGRTLVYQDCCRDLDMEVGAGVVTALGKPLSLLVTSLRWLTYRAAMLYRSEVQDIYTRLVEETGSGTVDLLRFWGAADGVVFSERHLRERLPIHRAVAEFQAHWEEILQLPDGGRRVDYTSEELRERVESVFEAPHAGWQMARYHSPDVMICADSVDSIRSGDYLLVLGEVHTAYNTAVANFAMCQHPAPQEVLEAITGDLPNPQVWVMPPKGGAEATIRTSAAVRSPNDYYMDIYGDAIVLAPPLETLLVSDFVVEASPSGLVVRSRDGRLQFDIIEFLGTTLTGHVLSAARLLGRRLHAPRITIDRLVLSRESWSFPAAEMEFARADEESERFLGARRWMREHDLPRLAFFRVHVERKPIYLDFESPIFVETFCKCVRRVLDSDKPHEHVTISEMLPTPDQAWLEDAAGQTYTSEFRIVVLDLLK